MTDTPTSTITYGRLAPGVPVRDIQAACAFYSDVLGFSKVFENGSPVGFMILKKDAAELHLNLKRDHFGSTLNVAAMLVDDVDALHAVCQAAGVRIIKSLADKDYGLRAFVFADPDGNRIDVGQRVGDAALPLELRDTRRPLAAADADLSGSTFKGVNLAGASFEDVSLAGARLANANFAGLAISNANLAGVTLRDCAVDGMTFEDVNLAGARLANVNLAGAAITDANLSGVTLRDCAVEGMTIDGVAVTELMAAWRAQDGQTPDAPGT